MKLYTTLLCCFFVATLLFCPPSKATGNDFPVIGDFHYHSWISTSPKELIPEFERGCRAVESYLNDQNKEFYGEDCISNLFIATTFIANTDAYVDEFHPVESDPFQNREKARQRYSRVVTEVIEKAITDGQAVTQKEHVNLIYTLIITISRDIVADYYHNVLGGGEEAKSGYLLAGVEDGRRIYREGEYKDIYDRLKAE